MKVGRKFSWQEVSLHVYTLSLVSLDAPQLAMVMLRASEIRFELRTHVKLSEN
jgi:hypothetical protein